MLVRLRAHLTYANVMATVAVFVALGGSSYAAITLSDNSVKSKHIAKGAVKRSDIGKSAVNSAKVADFSLLANDFQSGQLPAGPKGDTGAPGPMGPKGSPGATNVVARVGSVTGTTAGTARQTTVQCADGQVATGGGVSVANMPQSDFKVIGSGPNDVDVTPTGWRGTILPTTTDSDALVFAYVICASP